MLSKDTITITITIELLFTISCVAWLICPYYGILPPFVMVEKMVDIMVVYGKATMRYFLLYGTS